MESVLPQKTTNVKYKKTEQYVFSNPNLTLFFFNTQREQYCQNLSLNVELYQAQVLSAITEFDFASHICFEHCLSEVRIRLVSCVICFCHQRFLWLIGLGR